MTITQPFSETVDAFEDTGASLNVVSGKIAKQYQQHLCKPPRGFFVRTAEYKVVCQGQSLKNS